MATEAAAGTEVAGDSVGQPAQLMTIRKSMTTIIGSELRHDAVRHDGRENNRRVEPHHSHESGHWQMLSYDSRDEVIVAASHWQHSSFLVSSAPSSSRHHRHDRGHHPRQAGNSDGKSWTNTAQQHREQRGARQEPDKEQEPLQEFSLEEN